MTEAGNRPVRVIGLGCQRGCPASLLSELIEACLLEHRLTLSDITALASIDRKSDEPGLREVADHLQLPLRFFSTAALSDFETQLSHRSLIAFDNTGCYGVAESAALALASRLSTRPVSLLIPRRNNARATFALAGDG